MFETELKFKVTNCGNCSHRELSSSDDPFVDSWVRLYCGKNSDITIDNRSVIHSKCPLNKK